MNTPETCDHLQPVLCHLSGLQPRPVWGEGSPAEGGPVLSPGLAVRPPRPQCWPLCPRLLQLLRHRHSQSGRQSPPLVQIHPETVLLLDEMISQILVVTGGYGSDYLDSTETMREGGTYWTTVASASLPHPLGYFSAVTINNQILTFGATFYILHFTFYIFRRLWTRARIHQSNTWLRLPDINLGQRWRPPGEERSSHRHTFQRHITHAEKLLLI